MAVGRHVRVRGGVKVMCHWMFGILALHGRPTPALRYIAQSAAADTTIPIHPRMAGSVQYPSVMPFSRHLLRARPVSERPIPKSG